MPGALGLMRAIIGPDGDRQMASRLLEEALLNEIDPLLHVAFTLNMDVNTALARGAAHLGLTYFDAVPAGSEVGAPLRVERLADVHMVRAQTLGRDVAYAAPDFHGLMRLAALRASDPGLAQRVCIVPAASLRQYLARVASEGLIDGARQNLARHWPRAAASLELTFPLRLGFAAFLLGLVVVFIAAPYFAPAWFMPIWAFLLLLPAFIRIAAILTPVRQPLQEDRTDPLDLPVYSVLVPLRDEAAMVDQLCVNLTRLDYPAHKLDIIFVVEQRSPSTVEAVRRHLGNARFSLVEVPHALPLTKPKALDFALPFCRGEFVVVFDAEDRPEPGQLRHIVTQFRKAPHLHCIQARLVITGGARGGLSDLFAGEYAALFSVLLPALARWDAFLPLGGTSNHFRLASLRALGGWDAYNVTEDADLGVRLARRRLGCGTSSLVTFENAPETLAIWMGQRRRWMKGWMQTLLVHNRYPSQLLKDLGWRRYILFQILVFGMVLSPLLHVGFLLSVLALFLVGQVQVRLDLWWVSCLAVFCIGNGAAFLSQILGLVRTGQAGLIPTQVLLPFYWLGIAWATLRAMLDLTMRPFHWIKTRHRPVSAAEASAMPAR